MLAGLKRAVRRLEASGRAPAVSRLLRMGWYHAGNLRDRSRLAGAAEVLRARRAPAAVADEIAFAMEAFGGALRPIQNRDELAELLQLLHRRRPKRLLEIGTAKGGTLYLLCRVAAPDATVISVDLPFGRNGGGFPRWREPIYRAFCGPEQRLHLIRGDSHSPATRQAVEAVLGGARLDFVMIDGDHSYEGVAADFALYRDLVAPDGLIALHDSAPNDYDPTIDVSRFWDELKARERTREIFRQAPGTGMGIGLVEGPAPAG